MYNILSFKETGEIFYHLIYWIIGQCTSTFIGFFIHLSKLLLLSRNNLIHNYNSRRKKSIIMCTFMMYIEINLESVTFHFWPQWSSLRPCPEHAACTILPPSRQRVDPRSPRGNTAILCYTELLLPHST